MLRRWSAKILISEVEFDANESKYDLQKDQGASAVAEAREMIEAEFGSTASITLYKTTKNGTRRDKSFYVYRDGAKLVAMRG